MLTYRSSHPFHHTGNSLSNFDTGRWSKKCLHVVLGGKIHFLENRALWPQTVFSGCCYIKLFFLLVITIHSYLLQDNCCPLQQHQGPIGQVSSAIGNFKIVYVVVTSLVLFFQALYARIQYIRGYKMAEKGLWTRVWSNRTKGMPSNWQKAGTAYISGKNSSPWRCWGTGTSLEVLKTKLGAALSNLV